MPSPIILTSDFSHGISDNNTMFIEIEIYWEHSSQIRRKLKQYLEKNGAH